MKKTAVTSVVISILVVSAWVFIQSQPARALKSMATGYENTAMPDTIRQIFEKSCTDCHSSDGSSMAKSKINFSTWDTYSAEKQAEKAGKICKELKKGAMPPKNFRKNHPELIPDQKEVDAICKWADSFKK